MDSREASSLRRIKYCKGYLFINPNPGGFVAKMTSKHKNGFVKFITHANKFKHIKILHKRLKFNFNYQNDVLFFCFIKMLKTMLILGLRVDVDVSRAACSFNIDFQPLGRKSDHEEGGILGNNI